MNKKFLRVGMIFALVLSALTFGGCNDDDEDVSAPVPEMTSLTPEALSWNADKTDAKKIVIAGTNMNGVTITLSKLNHFTASLYGNTITVTPNGENTTNAEIKEDLVISAEGANTLKATLTHTTTIEAEAVELTSLTPDNLSWKAEESEAKAINVEGKNLKAGKISLSALNNYTAEVTESNGAILISVAPKAANELTEPVVETLTVSVEGGNSLEATLTHEAKVVLVPELTALTPNALTWDANAVDAKSIRVEGKDLAGATIKLSALTHYTAAAVEYNGVVTIAVTPNAANDQADPVVEKLTVSVEGAETSLEATLTHKGKEAAVAVPTLKKLTPNALSWAAEAVDAKTIDIEVENAEGKAITLSTLTAFTATLNGTKITVTPKAANELTTPVTEKLTVSVEGGNSLEATLTHEAKAAVTPDPEPATGKWVKVTADKSDWSGDYLVVCDTELSAENPRLWTLNTNADNQNNNDLNLYITVAEKVITAAKTKDGVDVAIADLANYVVTVAALGDGKYSIKIGEGKYIKNSSGNHTAGMTTAAENTTISASSMELQADGSVKIVAENTNLGLGFIGGKKYAFNYLPLDNGKNIGIDVTEDRSYVSLYEYVTE